MGATPGGGVQRLTVSDEDKVAKDLFVKWLKELNCEITIDEMGNIFGWRKGKNSSLTPLISGSHIDSQPKGGRFDGIPGVMSPLEVLRTIHENNITLERIGYKGKVPCKKFPFHASYEVHREQEPVLDRMGITIGAPKGILCLHWYDIYLTGTANQVGPTPMEGRNDALMSAAEMIIAVNKVAHQLGILFGTVGEIQNYPNSRNIIPDGVHFAVDFRSWKDDHALKAWEMVKREFQVIADRRGTPIRMEEAWRVENAPFNEKLVQNVMDSAKDLGYSVNYRVS